MPETRALAPARLSRPAVIRVPGVAIVLSTLCLALTVLAPGFASLGNLANVLSQSSVLLLLALPMTFVIMTEGIDLSVGAVLACGSLLCAFVVTTTGSIPLAVGTAVSVGVAFGLLNGVLVAFARIPPFVATLGTLGIAQGVALLATDGQAVVGIPAALRSVYSGTLIGLPEPVVLAAVAYAAFHLLLYRTRFGTYIVALGGNREALDLAGVSKSRNLLTTYLLSGAMAGAAAVLMTARMNSGHPTAGIGMEFEAVAAVAIGGTSFARGDGWIFGTLLGVLTVGVLRNGLNLLGVASSTQIAALGALVIVSFLIDRSGNRNR